MLLPQFLEDLTPQGRRAIVTIKDGYTNHLWYSSTQEAQDIIASITAETNTYFSLAAFDSESRKAANAVAAKAFWLDLDAGQEKQERQGDKVYATQQAAYDHLVSTLNFNVFPLPTHIIKSGAGLHAYWALAESIPAAVWVSTAKKFKTLIAAMEIKQDNSRTSDIASILRPVGTLNKGTEVTAEYASAPISFAAFSAAIDEFDVEVKQEVAPRDATSPIAPSYFKNIIIKSEGGRGCNQIQELVMSGGNVQEPLWRAGLSVAASCADEPADMEAGLRLISDLHPEFSIDATIVKASQTQGSTGCAAFEALNPGPCSTCRFRGTAVTNARQLGYSEHPTSKENQISMALGEAPSTPQLQLNQISLPAKLEELATIPAPTENLDPKRYFQNKAQGIMFESDNLPGIHYRLGKWYINSLGEPQIKSGAYATQGVTLIQKVTTKAKKNKEGEITEPAETFLEASILCGESLYMTERQGKDDGSNMAEQFCVTVEGGKDKDRHVLLSGSDLAVGKDAFSRWLGSVGIQPENPANIPKLQAYIRGWRNYMSNIATMTAIIPSMGWTAEGNIVAGTTLYTASSVRKVPLSMEVTRLVRPTPANASAERWSYLTNAMYPNGLTGVEAYQFLVLTQLAAPIYSGFVTGAEAGGIIHAFSKEGGRGKTTAIQRGLTALGNIDTYTQSASTSLTSLSVRQAGLSAFAIYVDEVTSLKDDKFAPFAYQSSAGKEKDRSEQGGGILRENDKSWKSYTLTSANKSLVETINAHDAHMAASAYRVLELSVPDMVWEVSQDIKDMMREHATSDDGAIAPIWFPHIVQHASRIRRDISGIVTRLKAFAKTNQADRFRINMAASVLAAGYEAVAKGIVSFDMVAVEKYIFGVLADESIERKNEVDPAETAFADFIAENAGNFVVCRGQEGNPVFDVPPREVVGRIDSGKSTICIGKVAFQKFCAAKGIAHKALITKHKKSGGLAVTKVRLLAGTGKDAGQSYVVMIHTKHASWGEGFKTE